jgi:hypothetical protein
MNGGLGWDSIILASRPASSASPTKRAFLISTRFAFQIPLHTDRNEAARGRLTKMTIRENPMAGMKYEADATTKNPTAIPTNT